MTKDQFEPLAKKYMDMVFRLAFSMQKSKADADDITQNVLLRLYNAEKPFASEEHVRNWLVRVTINECKKLWRSPWSRTEDFTDYSAALVFEDRQYSELYYAIMALDKKYRVVIVLHYYEGYSITEIAGLLNVPTGTVGTRLSRAREKLKQFLSEVDEHE